MKANLIIVINQFLAFVLGVLGFTGCREQILRPTEIGDDMIVVKYGCPTAFFDIHGRVTDETETPIEGIEVKVEAYVGLDGWAEMSQPTVSDAEGLYYVRDRSFPVDSVRVVALDIDGETNGAYKSDTVLIKPVYSSDNWNRGSVEATANFKLKKQNN